MHWKRITFLTWLIFFTLAGFSAAQGDYTIEQYLGIRYAKNGKFTFDDKWVVYLSNSSGSYQLWKIPVGGGAPIQLTFFEDRIREFQCSPTSGEIVFNMDNGGDENYQLYLVSLAGGDAKKLTSAPDRRHWSIRFAPDGKRIAYTANIRDKRYYDIYVMAIPSGEQRLVKEVDGYNQIETWSPTSDQIVVSTWEHNYNNNLHVVEAATGKHWHATPHQGWATYTQVVWPNEKKGKDGFFMVSDKGGNFRKLHYYRFKKNKIVNMDTAPWDTLNMCISADARILGYTMNTKGYSQIALIDRKKKRYWGKPFYPKGVVKSMDLSKDGKLMVFTFSGPQHNTDLWIYDKSRDETRRLTKSSTGGIDPETFIMPKLVEYQSTNGLDIAAFMYLPPGYQKDGTAPCILYMHGGPSAQERPDFAWSFQYFVSRGFVVFAPNVRGSSGYGKQFAQLDNKHDRHNSVNDAALGIKWLIRTKRIDPERVGVMGGSYGGYMVLALMTEETKMFAAGVNIVGISNFVTFLERTHPSRRKLREEEYGSLSKDLELLKEISPIHKIGDMKGALMVIHGAKDPRVPKHEADQVVQKAKAAAIEVEYLLYEDEGHGLSKQVNRLDAYPKMVNFLQKHLKKKEPDYMEPVKDDDAPEGTQGVDQPDQSDQVSAE